MANRVEVEPYGRAQAFASWSRKNPDPLRRVEGGRMNDSEARSSPRTFTEAARSSHGLRDRTTPPAGLSMNHRSHMPRPLVPVLLVIGVLLASLPSGLVSSTSDVTAQQVPGHEAFTRVLDRVVQMPRVDYAALEADREGLDAYLESLARTSEADLEASPREVQLAFWINAYNACMLKLVIDHYPIQAGGTGLFGAIRNRVAGYPDNSVWQIRNVFTRTHCRVAGEDRSQDEIEHEIIRPRFDEPRIHFAVNCAALSCPPLWPMAYTADQLDEQLDRAVRHLMAGEGHFRIEEGPPPTLRLNRVLDWYSEDFGGTEGLKTFFADYLSGDRRDRVLNPDTRVEFFEYDWTLNDTRR